MRIKKDEGMLSHPQHCIFGSEESKTASAIPSSYRDMHMQKRRVKVYI